MNFLYTRQDKIYSGTEPLLLRGMGLGNWFLPEGYMWKFYTQCDRPRRIEKLIEELCGRQYAHGFWEAFYDNYITENDFIWMKEHSINSVRLPLNARTLFSVDMDLKVSFREDLIKKVDHCVDWCKKHELYIFLDMHAAPGGQTGTNIDDSQDDRPDLFIKRGYKELLIECWKRLAERYCNEPAVGGYDLMNEPLPEWNCRYYPGVVPLYRRLISEIRKIDTKHIIVLEGVHWATDFSIFSEMGKEELKDNIVLEFHKYWSNPDVESLSQFLQVSKEKEVPIWMGEGGENNLDWYTTVFPMYERNGIGWCFWSYKKMDTENSPVSFCVPDHWQSILDYISGGDRPNEELARKAFDSFLKSISAPIYNIPVLNALLRKTPLSIPAHAYDDYEMRSKRKLGAAYRAEDPVSICFPDFHEGEPDWKRYGGEPQLAEEELSVLLGEGDMLVYKVCGAANTVTPIYEGEGEVSIEVSTETSTENPVADSMSDLAKTSEKQKVIKVRCIKGEVLLKKLEIC